MNDAVEKWLPVVGYEGLYSVSDMGRVRSEPRFITRASGKSYPLAGRILKTPPKESGHLVVSLHNQGRQKTWKVHALVMLAFVGERQDGMDTLHINGDHTDNRLANLRYGTRSENVIDMVQHGVHNHARKTHCKWGHPFDSANTYISPTTGQRCCRACRSSKSAANYQERKRRGMSA